MISIFDSWNRRWMSLGVWAILRVKKPKMETEKLIYIYSRSHPNQFSFKNQSINQSINQKVVMRNSWWNALKSTPQNRIDGALSFNRSMWTKYNQLRFSSIASSREATDLSLSYEVSFLTFLFIELIEAHWQVCPRSSSTNW